MKSVRKCGSFAIENLHHHPVDFIPNVYDDLYLFIVNVLCEHHFSRLSKAGIALTYPERQRIIFYLLF